MIRIPIRIGICAHCGEQRLDLSLRPYNGRLFWICIACSDPLGAMKALEPDASPGDAGCTRVRRLAGAE